MQNARDLYLACLTCSFLEFTTNQQYNNREDYWIAKAFIAKLEKGEEAVAFTANFGSLSLQLNRVLRPLWSIQNL